MSYVFSTRNEAVQSYMATRSNTICLRRR